MKAEFGRAPDPADGEAGRRVARSRLERRPRLCAHALRDIAKNTVVRNRRLLSPHATLEELHLAQKLLRGLGSENVDFRLRHSDFSADGKRAGIPSLGMKIADISALDRVLVVGSFLRKDHPLIAQRLRQSAKRCPGQHLAQCG
jgi:NADH-quinone oxidoreductase subunit G